MAGTHDVHILEIEGEFRVRPAAAAVTCGSGAKVKIRNLTGYDAMVFFPAGLLKTGVSPNDTLSPKGQPGDKKGFDLLHGPTEIPPIPAVATGQYSYQVFVIKNGTPVPAKGDSGPTLIVDP
jgi:hypothetical protein